MVDFNPNDPDTNLRSIAAEMPADYHCTLRTHGLPSVQIPLGVDIASLTIDGDTVPIFALPVVAQHAYSRYVEGGGGSDGNTGRPDVYMCERCAERNDSYGDRGYLTTSNNVGDYKSPYQCPHTYREETALTGGCTVGRYTPDDWEVEVTIDGEDRRSIPEGDDYNPTRKMTVRRFEDLLDDEPIDSTTVELPSEHGRIEGVTDDVRWRAEVGVHDETVSIAWWAVGDNGEVVTYSYRETEGPEYQTPNERLGYNVSDADEDDITTNVLGTMLGTTISERECKSRSFTKVWPMRNHMDREEAVIIPELAPDDVPNTASHLSRIQNQLASSFTKDEMMYVVARAVAADRDDDDDGGGGNEGPDGDGDGGCTQKKEAQAGEANNPVTLGRH